MPPRGRRYSSVDSTVRSMKVRACVRAMDVCVYVVCATSRTQTRGRVARATTTTEEEETRDGWLVADSRDSRDSCAVDARATRVREEERD